MPDRLPIEYLHAQYQRQADWTRQARVQLYRRLNLMAAANVLDVGCGTGVVTEEVAARTKGRVVGIDNDPRALAQASEKGSAVDYRLGDAEDLPFESGSFDLVFCHFVFLWLAQPTIVLREMQRVCRSGGAILLSAEPDYGGRIDFPDDLSVRDLQVRSLQRDGADPFVGRRLRGLFAGLGLAPEIGLVSGLWPPERFAEQSEAEWDLLERTTASLVAPEELARMRARDRAAVSAGTRFFYLPVFYAKAGRGADR